MREPHRYYDDLRIGESLTSGVRVIDEQAIIRFASEYDPQYFHTDPEAALEHPQFGRMVASGIHILAIWRQLDHEITGDVRWICGIEWKNLKWNKPLSAGDSVFARTEIIGKRPSASRADRGVVELRYSLVNQSGDEIVHFLSTNLIEKRNDNQAAKGQ